MRFGVIKVFCPMCKKLITYNDPKPPYVTMHHKTFGILCGKFCYDNAEMKYARMIMGKDDD